MAAFSLPYQSQDQCILYHVLPAEIRRLIFLEAAAHQDDGRTPYHTGHDFHYRPDYPADRVSHTALLRTCQRIYEETWHLPFEPEICHFISPITHRQRVAARSVPKFHMLHPQEGKFFKIQEAIEYYRDRHPGPILVSCIRLFFPIFMLQETVGVIKALQSSYLRPRKIHITKRHIDWNAWSSDIPIHIDNWFSRDCDFPDSCQEVCVELEHLARNRDQLDGIARRMANEWLLQRSDGMVLSARGISIRTAQWSRSSFIHKKRWVVFEDRPEQIDYHVVSVTWKLAPGISLDQEASRHDSDVGRMVLRDRNTWKGPRVIMSYELEGAGVPRGTSATVARDQVQHWNERYNR